LKELPAAGTPALVFTGGGQMVSRQASHHGSHRAGGAVALQLIAAKSPNRWQRLARDDAIARG